MENLQQWCQLSKHLLRRHFEGLFSVEANHAPFYYYFSSRSAGGLAWRAHNDGPHSAMQCRCRLRAGQRLPSQPMGHIASSESNGYSTGAHGATSCYLHRYIVLRRTSISIWNQLIPRFELQQVDENGCQSGSRYNLPRRNFSGVLVRNVFFFQITIIN